MGSALSFMEMDGYICEATDIMVRALEEASGRGAFTAQISQLSDSTWASQEETTQSTEYGSRCALAKKCAEHRLQIGLQDYAVRVFWLFSFVTTLHALMQDEHTSLHDAMIREIAFDAATGRVAVVVRAPGEGDSDYFSGNPTVAYIHDSVDGLEHASHRVGGGQPDEVCEAAIYVCDVRSCEVLKDLLEELMGAPGHYMCRMVDALERLTEGDRVKVVSVPELERVHSYITRCAVAMCEDSTALLADIKRAVVGQCGTRVTTTCRKCVQTERGPPGPTGMF